MASKTPRARTLLAASLTVALAVLAVGCADNASSHTPAPSSTDNAAGPGSVHVDVADADLAITDAVVHVDRSGDGALTMQVRNDDGVPEHLGMVATPGGGRGDLVGGKSAEGNGSLSTAGILLQDGTTVTFGDGGPRVVLHHVHGVTAKHTLPVSLQFGVAGLVRFQARVSSSA